MRIVRKAEDFATAMRFYAVALLGRGMSSPKIADILAIAVSTVVRAGHAYAAAGVAGLYDKRRGNGSPKADGAFRARVAELLRGTPEDFGWKRPTWTRELLCLQAQREGQAAVTVSTERAREDRGTLDREDRGTRDVPVTKGARPRDWCC